MLTAAYESILQVENAFTTRFQDIVVIAGAEVRVTLHFGGTSDVNQETCPISFIA